jgi:hypothetical protein
VIVEGEGDKFEFVAKVKYVVLNLEVFLLEGDDELVHDKAGEEVFLDNTESVFEMGQEEDRTAGRVELVTDAA